MKDKLLNKILIFSVVIFVIAIFLFIYFAYFKPTPAEGLKINFIGPNEVSALENYNYKVFIENGSNKKLTDVILKISLTEGAFFQNKTEKEMSLSLGELEPGKSSEQDLNLFFLNSGNLKETIKFNLNYKIENKDYIFTKEDNFSVLVKNPPIKAQIFLPTKIYVNQEFQTNFRLINLTNKKLNNIKVKIEVPSNYLLTSSLPKSENLYWEFSGLDPNETKDISLIGQIQDSKSSGIFGIKVDFYFQNFYFSLPKEIAKINILENPVVFYIKSTPDAKSVPIGSSLFYEITLENRSQSILENGEVKIIFDGPFDFRSLNTDGYFDEFEKAIYWRPRNKPELLTLKSGDKVKFDFSIALFQSYPILGKDSKNFYAKIRAEFRTPSIPAEVETVGKGYYVFQEDEKKIIGDILIDQTLVYHDPNFISQGPFPLEQNQPTALVWHLKIKSIGEDFNNLIISTKFPIGVNFTGKVGGDAILDNVKYDPKTGSFLYTINKLPANLGYLEKEMDLAFQLIVEPPANIEPERFVIIPEVQYSSIGDFSQGQINKKIYEIRGEQVLYR